MTIEQQNFISKVYNECNKYADKYNILCSIAVTSQAILESGWGKSQLAAKYNNYFGMKCGTAWKGKSVNLSTKEEYQKDVLTSIKDNFRVYDSFEEGIEGYYQFVNTNRYANLKGVTDPKTYLTNIKKDGYATSSKYVDNCMNVVNQYVLPFVNDKYNQYVTINITLDELITIRTIIDAIIDRR